MSFIICKTWWCHRPVPPKCTATCALLNVPLDHHHDHVPSCPVTANAYSTRALSCIPLLIAEKGAVQRGEVIHIKG
eukprot:561546-Pyramimonas_sp.AAC.2